jgi:hypothetical protein
MGGVVMNGKTGEERVLTVLLESIQDFNAKSGAQTAEVITLTASLKSLTVRLFWLGVIQVGIAISVGVIGALQLWAMLKGGA